VARLASLSPGLANLFTQTPGLPLFIRAAAGTAATVPSLPSPPKLFSALGFLAALRPVLLCEQRLRLRSTKRRSPFARQKRPSFPIPSTIPSSGHGTTAVEVLEAAGFSVAIPKRRLCCGRPLYDYGMLDLAKRLLKRSSTSPAGASRRNARRGARALLRRRFPGRAARSSSQTTKMPSA